MVQHLASPELAAAGLPVPPCPPAARRRIACLAQRLVAAASSRGWHALAALLHPAAGAAERAHAAPCVGGSSAALLQLWLRGEERQPQPEQQQPEQPEQPEQPSQQQSEQQNEQQQPEQQQGPEQQRPEQRQRRQLETRLLALQTAQAAGCREPSPASPSCLAAAAASTPRSPSRS